MGKGRFKRKSKAKPSPVTYCVVVEGIKTEKNYFNDAKAEFDALQNALRLGAVNNGVLVTKSCSLQVVPAGGRSFVNVLKKALAQTDLGHDKIWSVVDADFFVRLAEKDRDEACAIYERAVAAGIDVVFSRPCFEVWYRLHHECRSSCWTDGKTAKANITKLWPEYDTKPDKHWDLLRGYLGDAFANAASVRRQHGIPPNLVEDCDASTDVDWLVMELFFGINPNDPTQDGAL